MKQRVVAIANQKGGVGKTVTAVNLATGLAMAGMRVALVDIDPQGDATMCMGIEHASVTDELSSLLLMSPAYLSEPVVSSIVKQAYGVDIIPSTVRLSSVEREVQYNRDYRLRNVLRFLTHDVIVIDCATTLSFLLINALSAATDIIIPTEPEPLSIAGIAQIMDTVRAVRNELNPSLSVLGIVPTMVKANTRLHSDMMRGVSDAFGTQVFSSAIRQLVVISESTARHVPVIKYAPSSEGARDYLAFVDEVRRKLNG